jgi:hypothetical protein
MTTHLLDLRLTPVSGGGPSNWPVVSALKSAAPDRAAAIGGILGLRSRRQHNEVGIGREQRPHQHRGAQHFIVGERVGKRRVLPQAQEGVSQVMTARNPWSISGKGLLDCGATAPAMLSSGSALHGGADRHGATEIKEDVNVIRGRIDEDRRATEILQNASHVTVQGFAHGVVQDGGAVLGAENEVNVQPRKGLWHLARPFRALVCLAMQSQGVGNSRVQRYGN